MNENGSRVGYVTNDRLICPRPWPNLYNGPVLEKLVVVDVCLKIETNVGAHSVSHVPGCCTFVERMKMHVADGMCTPSKQQKSQIMCAVFSG